MTQHKAAALTSSLFARKGTASPASLLIADQEASGLHRPLNGAAKAGTNGKPQPQSGEEEGGAGLGIDLGHQQIPVAALNGTAGRRKAPSAEPELPLLAFVEAQSASAAGEGSGKRTAEESAGDSAATGGRTTTSQSAAGASPAGQDDLPPAASLLDSGAQALRRVNGPAAATPATANGDPLGAVEAPTVEVVAEEVAEALERADSAASDSTDADFAAPETVSGDDKVTAIEDAPEDHAGDLDAAPQAQAEVTLEAEDEAEPDAAPEDVAGLSDGEVPDTKAQQPEAPGAAANDVDAADDAAVAPAAAEVVETTAAAVSATVALREAAAQRPGGPAPLAAPATEPVRTPAVRPTVLPWKRAAVVALGLALGLGGYVTLTGTPSDAPMEQPLPTAEPGPARSDKPGQPDQLGAAEPSTGAAAESAPGPAAEDVPAAVAAGEVRAVAPVSSDKAAAAGAPQPELPEPSFDIIRIEPNGQSIIAGRAVPLSEWILLNNGEPIASIRADINGEWVVLPDATLVPGANAFSLVAKAEQGRVAIPAPDTPATNPGASVPAGSESPEATPPGPRSEAVSETSDSQMAFALPKPKPEGVPEVLQATAVAVSPAGAYEVQFASVRQSSDAERERRRLVDAFPVLLGRLELRVQEASVEGAGTFYRVRSGAMDNLGSARGVCRQLEAAGQGCLVVRRAPQQAQTELVLEPAPKRPAARQQAERPL